MGERGPAPKRSSQRRRQNTDSEPEQVDVEGTFEIPTADENWHQVAKQWFNSLADSGQSRFYEPSDWAMAFMMAESISRDLKPQVVGINEETNEPVFAVVPMKGASLSAYLKGMTGLLVNEADRRRAGLELQRGGPAEPPSDEDEVAQLDAYRNRVAG